MSSVRLEDISHLSREIQALVAAGLPLEQHLASVGRRRAQWFQSVTQSLAEDLSQGTSLSEAVRRASANCPRIVAASVAAGIRTGRLSEAVEVLGDLADDLVELRHRILRAISYPLTVAAIGITLFVVFLRVFLHRVDAFLTELDRASGLLHSLVQYDRQFWWWPVIFPVLALLMAASWFISGRAASMAFQGPERVLLLLPGVRSLVRDLQFYTMVRVCGHLVDRDVPLDDALLLAGACSGDSHLDEASQRAAERIRRGEPLTDSTVSKWKPGRLPPLFVTALLPSGVSKTALQERLSGVAGYYRRRLQLSVMWLRNVIPLAMMLIIGGGSVAIYAVMVFWPISEIYQHLGQP